MKTLRHLIVYYLFFYVSTAFAQPPSPHYALIVDAGSTGSRVHLFEYFHEKLPLIHEIFSENIKPGLSSFENNPQDAGSSLKKPLDDVLVEIKKRQLDQADVPIRILATAGMRLLKPEKQAAIYKQVSLYLHDHYSFPVAEIKTLSGEMEGVFGWLDLNYLAGNFQGLRDTTLGSIDVGGASIQLVFSTLDTSKPQNEFKLHLGDQDYIVYSTSFLRLGLNEALNQMNQQDAAASCYPANYPFSKDKKGNFKFRSCGQLYSNIIKAHFSSELIPSLADKKWVAYSGAYYTFNFFQTAQNPNRAVLNERLYTVCSQSWEQLTAAYPKESEGYLSKYCANGVYLSYFFFDNLQLGDNQLRVSNQINQQNLDWTLGALLYQLVNK